MFSLWGVIFRQSSRINPTCCVLCCPHSYDENSKILKYIKLTSINYNVVMLKLCDSELLQVCARSHLYSLQSKHTNISLDLCDLKRPNPDEVCEVYHFRWCGILVIFCLSALSIQNFNILIIPVKVMKYLYQLLDFIPLFQNTP